MAAGPTIDVDALLAPIPGANPAGQDIRYAGPHDAIKEARRADDPLTQGDWQRETKTANWAAVIKLSTEAIGTKSKDLQIGVWLTEALLKRHGFAGLRDGFKLLHGLHERFWDSMYPAIQDGDLDYRAGPMNWLNKELALAVKAVPLTTSSKGQAYSYLHWEESRAIDNLGRRNPEAFSAALAEGKITGEQFDKSVSSTPLTHCLTLYEDLDQSCQELNALARSADEKFGRDAPSLIQVKQALEESRTLLSGIIKKKGGTVPGSTEPSESGSREAAATTPTAAAAAHGPRAAFEPHPSKGGIDPTDRTDALRRLAAVADFFRRTEPHSPVSYLVQRAVRWGEMPFERWLQEVITDQTVLTHVRETLGLREADTASGNEASTQQTSE